MGEAIAEIFKNIICAIFGHKWKSQGIVEYHIDYTSHVVRCERCCEEHLEAR